MTSARLVRITAVAFLLAVSASPAWAQASAQTARPPQRPPRVGTRVEIAAQATWTGPISFGQASQTLTRPDGTNLVVFNTDSRLAPGYGVGADLGILIGKKLVAEMSGSWNRATLETRITGDVESADPITATASMDRFTIEGGGLWTIARRGRASFFVRGSAGWMREVAETSALVEDGIVAHAGGGMKYWWRDRPRGTLRRFGVRIEARAQIRSSGLTLGEPATTIAPVISGGLVFGF
jgi:opacity protein-like surface antigen